MATRPNELDQSLDIAGSKVQASDLNLLDEPNQYGAPLVGQTGTTASISSVSGNFATVVGMGGFTPQSEGAFLQLSGGMLGNQGNFTIVQYISAFSVIINNPSAVVDAGLYSWTEREPYTLQTDLNFARTDRAWIKGVEYYETIPSYYSPMDTTTPIAVNLANIAGNTVDAIAYVVNSTYLGIPVSVGNTQETLTYIDNLKHAYVPSNDATGVPCFDVGEFTGNWVSCYVQITDNHANGGQIFVLSGPHIGEIIFAETYADNTTSPNSVNIHFYSAPAGVSYANNSTVYSWEAGQTSSINIQYGYNEILGNLDINSFRAEPSALVLSTSAAPSGAAGGDLDGYYPNPSVSSLQGNPVESETLGFSQDGYVLTWDNGTGGWNAQPAPGYQSGITPVQHEGLRQLIHLADGGGPFESFQSGAYKVTTYPEGSPFYSVETWYTDTTENSKIVDTTITRNSANMPATITWHAYATDGVTVLSTVMDTITYVNNIFESSRIRTIM